MAWPKGVQTRSRLKVTDERLIELFKQGKSVSKIAGALGMSTRGVQNRKAVLQDQGYTFDYKPDGKLVRERKKALTDYKARIRWKIPDGIVMVGSDAHYWPGYVSAAHRGFLHLIKRLKPTAIVLN